MKFRFAGLAASLMLVSGCGGNTETDETEIDVTTADTGTTLDTGTAETVPVLKSTAELAEIAVASPDRPEEDLADDASRKPAEVLKFIGIAPGETILELEAGAGWYTELLSRVTGPEGKVIMQNPAFFNDFPNFEEAIASRLKGGRLANVESLEAPFDALPLDDKSIDVVTWILGPHELYYKPDGATPSGDPDKTFAEIVRVMKGDGRFIIIDHADAEGTPPETANETHRIDPMVVMKLADHAGLVVDEVSMVLRNPDDDYSLIVFDPQVRRKTDRFIVSFRKADE